MESTLQFVELLEECIHRLDPASHVTTGSHNTFERMVRAHGRDRTPSFLLCSLFSDALGLPSAAYLDFPRPGEWESAISRYRTLFIAFEIRPQDVLLRLPDRRIGPHVQEYLLGRNSEWEGHLNRWVLGVQSALGTGAALPPFPAAGEAPTAGEALASESDPQATGQMEPGDAAARAAENPQNDGDRDVTPAGRSVVPLTQSSAVPATPGATASRHTGAEEGASATRGR